MGRHCFTLSFALRCCVCQKVTSPRESFIRFSVNPPSTQYQFIHMQWGKLRDMWACRQTSFSGKLTAINLQVNCRHFATVGKICERVIIRQIFLNSLSFLVDFKLVLFMQNVQPFSSLSRLSTLCVSSTFKLTQHAIIHFSLSRLIELVAHVYMLWALFQPFLKLFIYLIKFTDTFTME